MSLTDPAPWHRLCECEDFLHCTCMRRNITTASDNDASHQQSGPPAVGSCVQGRESDASSSPYPIDPRLYAEAYSTAAASPFPPPIPHATSALEHSSHPALQRLPLGDRTQAFINSGQSSNLPQHFPSSSTFDYLPPHLRHIPPFHPPSLTTQHAPRFNTPSAPTTSNVSSPAPAPAPAPTPTRPSAGPAAAHTTAPTVTPAPAAPEHASRAASRRSRQGQPTSSRTAKSSKRSGPPATRSNKRRKDDNGAATTDGVGGRGVPGVGPSGPAPVGKSTPPEVFQPSKRFADALQHQRSTDKTRNNGASDVWTFVRGVAVDGALAPRSSVRPKDSEKYPRIRCVFCQTRDWKNSGDSRKAIRVHLEKHHSDRWRKEVVSKGLKNSATAGRLLRKADRVFGIERFYELLTDWIVHDDMSINIIESIYLRRLLAFLGLNNITEKDIPHRTKLTELIFERFSQKCDLMAEDLRNATGRISFTLDIWSRGNLQPYMAVTAHYMARNNTGADVLRSALIAFRYLPCSHTGKNIADAFMSVLDDFRISHKASKSTSVYQRPLMVLQFGQLTMDNASNNDTGMEEIAQVLRLRRMLVTAEGNRIRCFPHVVNIAVKAGLKVLSITLPSLSKKSSKTSTSGNDAPTAAATTSLTLPTSTPTAASSDASPIISDPTAHASTLSTVENPAITASGPALPAASAVSAPASTTSGAAPVSAVPEQDNNGNDETSDWDIPVELLLDDEYLDVLNSDIVAAARALVIAIRASGLRREDFEVLIREGNMNREWLDEEGNFLEMPVLALLRDVDTRWSSTFLMINRLLVLYNAVAKLLASDKYKATLGPLALSPKQLEVLDDVRKFLGALHAAQQLLSSQQTPTLCHVLPVYSKLIKTLADVKDICPKISHGIQKSIDKLNEYMAKAKDNRTYALAMIINPFFKFTWLEANAPDEVEGHRQALEEAMFSYRKSMRKDAGVTQTTKMASRAPYTTTSPSSIPSPLGPHASAPALALSAGMDFLDNYVESIRRPQRSASVPQLADASRVSGNQATPAVDTEEERRRQEATADEEDWAFVRDELRLWESKDIILPHHPDAVDFDLIRYWQAHKGHFPTLYAIALDIMPVQASAVPCERVFSSSKETDTTRRANLEPRLMEALQMLKFYLHEEELNTILREPVRNATEAECSFDPPADTEPEGAREEDTMSVTDSESDSEELLDEDSIDVDDTS